MKEIKENIHAIQERSLREECKAFEQVEYVKSLEAIINMYCEESRVIDDSMDEWVRKFEETMNLNLKKLDARRMNVEAKIEKLNQTVLENKKNMVERSKMRQIKEFHKEPVPRDLPYVRPYVPPIPFPGRLKAVRNEETNKDQLKKIETRSLHDKETVLHANVESSITQYGMIPNSSFIANNLASFPLQVAEIIIS